jgi:predicted enzyme related to lactoylglutathione lyase
MNLANAPVVANMPAVDVDRAKAFYTEKLGLKSLEVPVPDALMFEAGDGTKLFLYKTAATKAEHTAASFKVDDVEAVVKELKDKGVEFESYDMDPIKTDEDNISRMGELMAAWFKDSEGNILCVANM